MLHLFCSSYITALALPLIAAIAAWIAYRQSQIARNKLKLDLFDRRMAVYESVRDTLGAVVRKRELTQEQQMQYLQGTRSARWLFGIEIFDYLDKSIWLKIVDLEYHTTMSQNTVDSERSEHISSRTEIFKWLIAQQAIFDLLVEDHLTLHH